jgi:hypothetical protein
LNIVPLSTWREHDHEGSSLIGFSPLLFILSFMFGQEEEFLREAGYFLNAPLDHSIIA